MSYTKLFESIVTSSIWVEDDTTRIVWITMMAIADKHGEVHASIPGLARVAGVSIEACQQAIAKFQSPDHFSRTKDDEGRRVEDIDGGWRLLNHAKYRRMASVDEQREKTAARVRAHRERLKRNAFSNGDVTGGNGLVTLQTDNAEADSRVQSTEVPVPPKTEVPPPPKVKPPRQASPMDILAEDIYKLYPRKEAKGDAIPAIVKALKRPGVTQEILASKVAEYAKAYKASGKNLKYCPYPATWFNDMRWEDDPAMWLLDDSNDSRRAHGKTPNHYPNRPPSGNL